MSNQEDTATTDQPDAAATDTASADSPDTEAAVDSTEAAATPDLADVLDDVLEDAPAEPVAPVREHFAGQVAIGGHLVVATREHNGRQFLEIRHVGGVGEGFQLLASRIQELARLVNQIELLPEQE